jgi:hypothetical protein
VSEGWEGKVEFAETKNTLQEAGKTVERVKGEKRL